MLFNHFKISFRQLMKNKTFTFINIFGLTLGFLCFILLALYVHDELSYDLFHSDSQRMYRVLQHEKQEDGTIRTVAPVAARVGKESAAQFPEVEEQCSITSIGRATFGNDPLTRDYEPIMITDDNFLTFFDFPLLEGDPATALSKPNSIVITESTAKKYFGDQPAMGKKLWTNNDKVDLTVTGILKDFPKNSHLQFSILFSESTWPSVLSWYTNFVNTDWSSNTYITYLKLRQGTEPSSVETKIETLVKNNFPKDQEFKSEFSLQPFSKIHLYSQNIQGSEGNQTSQSSMNPFYLYMFGAVGFLLLLIACLNYMNLSTAAAFKRTREIGTRKTLGAQRTQLIMQFVSDSVVLSLISLALALVILQIMLPAVNQFTQKELTLTSMPLEWMLSILAIILLAGIASALYPAFVTARVSPAEALKKEIKIANSSLPVRKVLVVAQFTISIIMIASTLIIYRQLQFMRDKDIGIETENLLVIDINSGNLRRNFENVKAEFAKPSEVLSISTSTRVPGEWKSFPFATVKPLGEPNGNEMIYVGIDNDFLTTYNIQLKEGRNFTAGPADSSKVILTELAVQKLGLTNPIGQIIEIPTVRFGGSIENLGQPLRVEVVGVAENFHFESLRTNMMPVIFAAPNTAIQRIDYYTLKIKTSDWPGVIEKLKAINTKIDADNPLEYTFLDSRFEEFYQADAQRGQIFLTFSMIVVFIACMGLFALVSYSVESRTKEIGIRKVLGASVQNIVGMVSKEFLWLILIACVLAIPAAYFFAQKWLQEFAYRIDVGAGVFLMAGFLTILIASITISLRSVKAATVNPVKSLRSE
ncbi:MAG TPA: ABC transporter permease [Cyclobacteriaceae bacterium]|nr:ABC transporter permease [Cyclobacteriaceae bacterium]